MASKNTVEIFWFQSAGFIAFAKGGEECWPPGLHLKKELLSRNFPQSSLVPRVQRGRAGRTLKDKWPIRASVQKLERLLLMLERWDQIAKPVALHPRVSAQAQAEANAKIPQASEPKPAKRGARAGDFIEHLCGSVCDKLSGKAREKWVWMG
jgi:hypothetical protein